MTVQTVPAYLQNASHSAALFRQAVSFPLASGGIGGDGTELFVYQQSTPNMSVAVRAGRAFVPGTAVSPPSTITSWTTQGMYNVLNDATLTVTIAAADATNPRIDVVYVGVQDSYYSGGVDAAIIGVVTGVPSSSPVAPAVPSNSLALANVAVAANASSIIAANITMKSSVAAPITKTTTGVITSFGSGWAATSGYPPTVRVVGNQAWLFGAVTRTVTTGALAALCTVPNGFAPVASTFLGAGSDSTKTVQQLLIATSGVISIPSQYGDAGSGAVVPLFGTWFLS